ncbi:MAG TPA: sulfite exporter TauE/SafE family protein [Roseateles sp.]
MAYSLILGAITGAALGLTGAGGGILAIPLLTVFTGLSHTQAAPIALLAIAMAASTGAAVGLREGAVRYRAALLIGSLGMLAAPAGVWLANRTPQAWLTTGLAGAMTLSALSMYRHSLPASAARQAGIALPPCYWSAQTGRFVWNGSCASVMAVIGLVTGSLSGLLGVGGGFLLVPALTRLSNLKIESIVGTSQAVIALVSSAGAMAAASQRDLQWQVALPFTLAAVAALVVARGYARRLPARVVKRSFAVLSGSIAFTLFIDVARSL